MKKLKYLAIVCIAIAITSCGNDSKKEEASASTIASNGITSSTFKVWGNCDMCKETIEGSLKVEGVTNVYNNFAKTLFHVYIDARYDKEYVKRDIEAAILCAE